MNLKLLVFAFAILLGVVTARIDPQNLRCLVCQKTFDELNKVIKNVERWKKVDVGNFRMDASGNTMQQKVPAHRSAVYISEVIDGICKKMDDYVRVYYKATGKLAIMQLMTAGGSMNPDFSKAKFVTDDDLNKSLEYYVREITFDYKHDTLSNLTYSMDRECERMFEDNEEEITDLYKNRPEDDIMPDAEREICFNHAKLCEEWMLPTEEDTTWTPEMEAEYVKVHGPDPYGFGGLPQQQHQFAPDVSDSEGYDDSEDIDAEEDGEEVVPEREEL